MKPWRKIQVCPLDGMTHPQSASMLVHICTLKQGQKEQNSAIALRFTNDTTIQASKVSSFRGTQHLWDAPGKHHLSTVQNQNQRSLETISQQIVPLGPLFRLWFTETYILWEVTLFSITNRQNHHLQTRGTLVTALLSTTAQAQKSRRHCKSSSPQF